MKNMKNNQDKGVIAASQRGVLQGPEREVNSGPMVVSKTGIITSINTNIPNIAPVSNIVIIDRTESMSHTPSISINVPIVEPT